MMIALPLLAMLIGMQDAPAAANAPEAQRLAQCVANPDAAANIEAANAWMAEGGGLAARECLGLAFLQAGQDQAALTTFLDAANAADTARSPRAGALWSFAGTAALMGENIPTARDYLNRAIASGQMSNGELSAAHATRSRVRLALNDSTGARQDMDAATRLSPEDGNIWLLSATLARRSRDFARAQADIQQAAALSPRNPAVALEAGNIAWMLDNGAAARRSWESVLAITNTGAVADVARRRLADLAEEERAAATPPPAPNR
jgi:tetratricopeptide (TPR) repeat protein